MMDYAPKSKSAAEIQAIAQWAMEAHGC
jgi:hypothetical protein